MGHTVTLGGDRLGSGKKNKVELHGYERSTHDLGYVWRSTISAGTLVPFMVEIGLPGDTFDIDLNADIMTHPTIGPLFGSYKVQLDIFEAPIRLYNAQLHNNKLKIGMNMSQIKFPVMDLLAKAFPVTIPDIDNAQVNPSCILAYLGIRGIGYIPPVLAIPNALRVFNATGLLAYWDIYKNYYSNKMEEIGAVIHATPIAVVTTINQIDANNNSTLTTIPFAPTTGSYIASNNTVFEIAYTGASPIPNQIIFNTSAGYLNAEQLSYDIDDVGTTMYVYFDFNYYGAITFYNWKYITDYELQIAPPQVFTFPLENIDLMREYLLSQVSTNPVHIEDAAGPGGPGLTPYSYITNFTGTATTYLQNQEGLGLKTYQSDLFNNWLNTEWIDGTNGISEITAIDTTGGSFTIDTLNLSKKVYMMLNRIMVSGGTYDDWLRAVWDHEGFTRAETPIYHGGLIKELVFQEVVSNSASQSAQGGQPLGTLAGKGVLTNKHKGGQVRIKVNEPSIIIGIISLTPRIDYSQGNAWFNRLQSLDDLHKPQLDEIGFQELITEQMAWWDTTYNLIGDWTTRSAGKQPAWINYMTNINKTYGNFAIRQNEMFMTLNRRYEFDTNNETILDLTTYIDPVKFNSIFAQTSLDAMNFWAQIKVDNIARRKMSAKVMPNL